MATVPTFQVVAGTPIDLQLIFDGLTKYSIAIADWNGTTSKWVPRTPYIATNALSHGTAPYGLGTVAAGDTVLLAIPLSMTSLGGSSAVSTTAQLSQAGAPKGEVSTPPSMPGPNQAAEATMQIYLRGA